MNFKQLYVHDGTLRGVIEDGKERRMTLLVDLPRNEWSDELTPKRIIFHDVLSYEVHEGPDKNMRTILDLRMIGAEGTRHRIQQDTTSGCRVWDASSFEVADEES